MNIKLFPIWTGKTAFCIAGGQSLTQEQVDYTMHHKTIAVNDAYKLAPWADILYACDNQWWEWHKGVPDFEGYKLQHNNGKSIKDHSCYKGPYPGVDSMISDGLSGFSDRTDRIRTGGNSGYQALHIAIQLGASTIILLGYDMHANEGPSHWFGEHPNGKQPDDRYTKWIKEFSALREEADRRDIEIINATPGSALKCFTEYTF